MESKQVRDLFINSTVKSFSNDYWLFIQCGMLALHYGFDKTMPWWVVWFPTVMIGIGIGVLIAIAILWLVWFIIKTVWESIVG